MSSSPPGGDANQPPSRAYRLVSATYQDKEYPEGTLRVNEAGNEIEISQWTGKKKRTESVIVRFRLEPNTEVLVDGALLRVSGLSVTLESPTSANGVADLLGRPARELEAERLVAERETLVTAFLQAREDALDLISRVKVDPRGALLAADSTSTGDAESLGAIYSKRSARVVESFEKMRSSLSGEEKG
ncbi:MAG TPA: hypothetical protein VGS04_02465, partial [Nitrososphaerales archaeon]|nr:hypothetical protein [Nitrososphaerales archaeon]